MLCHVEREQLGLADLGDRRRDGDDQEPDPEGEESEPPAGDGLVSARERACTNGIRDCNEDDRRELERLERPARQQRRLVHVADCTLGPWAGSRRTRRRASRSRRPTRSSSASDPRVASTGAGGFGGFAGLLPAGRRAAARGVDRLGRDEADSRARTRRAACVWRRPRRSLHQRRDHDRRRPAVLLDYVAANRIDLEEVAELVDGFVDVCREAGCALIGGETAELPGIYREDELDFAGTVWAWSRAMR